jgi:hypothetical protein
LERLVTDKHESSQRCAAEIIAGEFYFIHDMNNVDATCHYGD